MESNQSEQKNKEVANKTWSFSKRFCSQGGCSLYNAYQG